MTDVLAATLEPASADRAAWQCFDAEWYACAYPDAVAAAGAADFTSLRNHYCSHGQAALHAPNMFFDEAWYRARYADVTASIAAGEIASGYAHYCTIGLHNRAPHWLFDREIYALAGGEAGAAALQAMGCVNAYDHYLRIGVRQGRVAHLLFDPARYRAALGDEPDAAAAIDTIGALPHFLRRVWFDQRDARTSQYFDMDWFLARYPEAGASIRDRRVACAVHAYLMMVGATQCSPLPQFDEAFYLAKYPDVATMLKAGLYGAGYEHFLRAGAFALRQPTGDIDLRRIHDDRPALRIAVSTGASRDAFSYLLGIAPIPGLVEKRPASPAASVAGGESASRTGKTARLAPSVPAPLPAPLPLGVPPALLPAAAPALLVASQGRATGQVDVHGYAAVAGGWLFIGALPPDLAWQSDQVATTARFERGAYSGTASLATYTRLEEAGYGTGFVLLLPGSPSQAGAQLGGLVEVEIDDGSVVARLPANPGEAGKDGRSIIATATTCLAGARGGAGLTRLKTVLARPQYTGASTIDALRDRVFLEIEEAVLCPALEAGAPDGIVLCGWLLALPGVVEQVLLHSGTRCTVVALDQAMRIDRPDVLDGVGMAHGIAELSSGFLAYVPDSVRPDEAAYLELRTARGEHAYRPLQAPKLRGMDAIRFVLERAELRYNDVAPAFERVFGPAVLRLNHERQRVAPAYRTVDFGVVADAPVLSIIVTLFGRLDFIEYQMAFLSRRPAGMAFELIYVLDDPARRRQLQNLAVSVFARFAIPFRLVLLARNLGYAPANNVGLGLARGGFVCFLNSDVFPGTDDWMERLVGRLRTTPRLGAVGPMLLFEDGSVQHQGIRFERVPEFANWHFAMHPGKGWRPAQTEGLIRSQAITGACIVLAREVAQALGGFDPGYVIGDFEDADMCLKLAERGLYCAVDTGVVLYHMERQSQASSQKLWRMNLTLYNAWVHEGRWGTLLAAAEAEATDAPPAALQGQIST